MLGRLMKYEFRMQFKTVLITNIAVILAAVASFGVSLFATIINPYGVDSEVLTPVETVGFVGCIIAMIMLFVATMVSMYVVVISGYFRFYRTMYTSTGYMTLMLPISPWKIVVAKGLTLALYELITAVFILVSAGFQFLLIVNAFSPMGLLQTANEIISEIPILLSELLIYTPNAIVLLFEGLLLSLVSSLASLCVVYMAITIGSVIAKKNKGLVVIAIYFAVKMALSFVTEIAYYFFLIVSFTNFYVFYALLILMYAGIGIGAFFINNHLLCKKLNLE